MKNKGFVTIEYLLLLGMIIGTWLGLYSAIQEAQEQFLVQMQAQTTTSSEDYTIVLEGLIANLNDLIEQNSVPIQSSE